MKKKAAIIAAAFAVIALGASAWLYGYSHQKSNDNLPNLASIPAMDEAEINELLAGYRKIQLREVWNAPDETRSNEDVWIIDERTALIVSYSSQPAARVTTAKLRLEEVFSP